MVPVINTIPVPKDSFQNQKISVAIFRPQSKFDTWKIFKGNTGIVYSRYRYRYKKFNIKDFASMTAYCKV
jgi:hypothetical protein